MKKTFLILSLLFASILAVNAQSKFITIKNKADLDAAKLKAEKEGKMLYMIIAADWCGACNYLKANLESLSSDPYFKDNVLLAITDYDKFGDSDLVWEIFDGSASWAAPTNVYFMKGKDYPEIKKGSMSKEAILTKVKTLNP